MTAPLLIAVGYLLGSLPFGLLLTRWYPAANGAPVPSTDAMRDFFGTTCLSLANAYIGGDILAQEVLDFGGFYPTDAGWAKGDRSITCYLTRLDHKAMTSSVKGGPKPS